jgi:hypothetical protein
MKGISYLVLRFGLYLFFVVVTSPIPIVCGFGCEYVDAHQQWRFLRWIFVPGFLIWFIGLPWLTSKAAGHMAFEDQTFTDAVKMTFCDLRFVLGFLPLVGHWFVKDPDTKDDNERGT